MLEATSTQVASSVSLLLALLAELAENATSLELQVQLQVLPEALEAPVELEVEAELVLTLGSHATWWCRSPQAAAEVSVTMSAVPELGVVARSVVSDNPTLEVWSKVFRRPIRKATVKAATASCFLDP